MAIHDMRISGDGIRPQVLGSPGRENWGLRRRRYRRSGLQPQGCRHLGTQAHHLLIQPGLGGGEIVGVEALLRWPRRPQGALPPDAFIGIAESSGLIYALGQFVLERACSELQPLDDLLLSVNISPAQFRDPEFESRVVQVLGRCHFPARRLQLEVTESYVLENPERAKSAIENLRALGIAVALDDFGTGYSSIGYLRSFSFDSLKIDKSLAGLVDVDTQAAELVRGTVRIAGALGITVVAEGVENQQQLALLRRAGCDRLQGFFFSEPMPVASLLQLRQQQG